MLQLVREIPIRIVIEKTPSSRRGFLFHVAAGFRHDVDPLSGMSVNLMNVDAWLGDLKRNLENAPLLCETESLLPCFAELMAVARLELTASALKLGVHFSSLTFREERGWSFSWENSMAPENLVFKYRHYLELVPTSGAADLLRVNFEWLRHDECLQDYQHEGFLILKSVAVAETSELISNLSEFMGHQLITGTRLVSISIDFVGEGYSLCLKSS